MPRGDPYVALVDHVTAAFRDRHQPAVVAHVALILWARFHDPDHDVGNRQLAARVGDALQRMPPSVVTDSIRRRPERNLVPDVGKGAAQTSPCVRSVLDPPQVRPAQRVATLTDRCDAVVASG